MDMNLRLARKYGRKAVKATTGSLYVGLASTVEQLAADARYLAQRAASFGLASRPDLRMTDAQETR